MAEENISEDECKPPKPSPCKSPEDELKSFRELTLRQQRIIGKHSLTPRHLETGFGIHTHKSLELALLAAKDPIHVCECVQCHPDSVSESSSTQASLTTLAQDQVKFLMGLAEFHGEEEEGQEVEAEAVEQPAEDLVTGSSESMRRAQRYLREHKIFEFYQFLIAHLLSANAFDPINLLINILDKCLVYRSGMAEPPLLYENKHIECLFNLMDRMRTGFIDLKQYETGMNTLGIKSFNPNPPISAEGMVPKSFFIEEAHECFKELLNDLLRKRPKQKFQFYKVPKAPPPSNCSIINFNRD